MGKKTYAVFAPNKHYNGTRFAVPFERGRGKATEKQAKLLVNAGYRCPAIEKKAERRKALRKVEKPEAGGSDEEAAQLTQVDGIGPERAKALYAAGVTSLERLAEVQEYEGALADVAEQADVSESQLTGWSEKAGALLDDADE